MGLVKELLLQATVYECGGPGELLLDFVSDYVVRCQNCKKSTWTAMNAIDAIEVWNAGELHCDLQKFTIE